MSVDVNERGLPQPTVSPTSVLDSGSAGMFTKELTSAAHKAAPTPTLPPTTALSSPPEVDDAGMLRGVFRKAGGRGSKRWQTRHFAYDPKAGLLVYYASARDAKAAQECGCAGFKARGTRKVKEITSEGSAEGRTLRFTCVPGGGTADTDVVAVAPSAADYQRWLAAGTAAQAERQSPAKPAPAKPGKFL